MNALRAAHAIALHLLLVVRVGVHHVYVEVNAVLLCKGQIGVRLDRVEDAERLCVHRLDVEPPGFSCCGHRRGHGGWGGQLVTGFSMGGTRERLRFAFARCPARRGECERERSAVLCRPIIRTVLIQNTI